MYNRSAAGIVPLTAIRRQGRKTFHTFHCFADGGNKQNCDRNAALNKNIESVVGQGIGDRRHSVIIGVRSEENHTRQTGEEIAAQNSEDVALDKTMLSPAEGMKEDFESWHNFFIWLKERGLTGVRLIVGDKCLGMLESIADVFPEAKYQRCTVHFYRNVFSVVPRGRMREVSLMLKAIHAQENKEATREKAASVVAKLREMKLSAAAKKVEDGVDETLTYMDFPTEHWTRIRTNNVTERVNREIKRRTKAIGAFPDGQSALMLVCARLRYVAASDWGTKRYLNMDHLFQMELMNNTEPAEASAG